MPRTRFLPLLEKCSFDGRGHLESKEVTVNEMAIDEVVRSLQERNEIGGNEGELAARVIRAAVAYFEAEILACRICYGERLCECDRWDVVPDCGACGAELVCECGHGECR